MKSISALEWKNISADPEAERNLLTLRRHGNASSSSIFIIIKLNIIILIIIDIIISWEWEWQGWRHWDWRWWWQDLECMKCSIFYHRAVDQGPRRREGEGVASAVSRLWCCDADDFCLLAMVMTGLRMYEVQHILPQSSRSRGGEVKRRGASAVSRLWFELFFYKNIWSASYFTRIR